jgi:hypothetical protein
VIIDGTAQAPAELGPLVRDIAAALSTLPVDVPAGAAPEPLRRRLTVLSPRERRDALIAALAAHEGRLSGIDIAVVDSRPGEGALDLKSAVKAWPADGGAIVFVSGRAAVLREGWLAALVGWVTAHPEIGFATGLVVGADGNVVECGMDAFAVRRLICDATAPCPADFNADGGVDGADVEAFFLAWQVGDVTADVNQDGGVDGSDLEAFFVPWAAGGC